VDLVSLDEMDNGDGDAIKKILAASAGRESQFMHLGGVHELQVDLCGSFAADQCSICRQMVPGREFR